jgi:hypothetical protein
MGALRKFKNDATIILFTLKKELKQVNLLANAKLLSGENFLYHQKIVTGNHIHF